MKVSQLPPYIQAWLKIDGLEALYLDLARHAGTTVQELEKINVELGGQYRHGWEVNSVTVARVVAGDSLWKYLCDIRAELAMTSAQKAKRTQLITLTDLIRCNPGIDQMRLPRHLRKFIHELETAGTIEYRESGWYIKPKQPSGV